MSGQVCGAVGGQHSTSNGRDCAALVSARKPLEMVAVEPRILAFHTIESYRTLQEDPIDDS